MGPSRPPMRLLACAGQGALARTLLLTGALVDRGGRAVVLTYTPGLALRQTFFGLEVVVRRDEPLEDELLRIGQLAHSRGAAALLIHDDRVGPRQAGVLRRLGETLAVLYYGTSGSPPEPLSGVLRVEPFAQPSAIPRPPGRGAVLRGFDYLPVHPSLRQLRSQFEHPLSKELRRLTVVNRSCVALGTGTGWSLATVVLEALSGHRAELEVTVLVAGEHAARLRPLLQRAAQRSRHRVAVRVIGDDPDLVDEALLADLLVSDDPEQVAAAAFLGTPTALLGVPESQSAQATRLAEAGVTTLLPVKPQEPLLADVLLALATDFSRRSSLSAAGVRAIDGRGGERIAQALQALLAVGPTKAC